MTVIAHKPLPVQQIEAALQKKQERVFSVHSDSWIIWVKRPGEDKANAGHHFQRVFAWLTRIEMLRPTVSRGGPDALKREVARLDRLRLAGFPVPDIAAVGDDFFATYDSGEPLMNLGRRLPPAEAEQFFDLVRQAATLLGRLHHQGLCHGRPSLKDIAVLDGKLTFLDMEEAPEQVMSMKNACLRDTWHFLASINRLESRWPGLCEAAWLTYKAAAPDALQAALQAQAQRLLPLAGLVSRIGGRRTGRDVQGVLHTIRLLAHR